MEKLPTYSSPEEKFLRLINERFGLWSDIIDDAVISADLKVALKKALYNFKDHAFTAWKNLNDAFYFTISIILSASEKEKNNDEAKKLFENLRDDIWSLYREFKINTTIPE